MLADVRHSTDMNAPFPPPKIDEYQDCLDLALLWQARFTQLFAELELLVGDCLQHFSKIKKPSVRVNTGQQITAAISELKRLTGPRGAFSKKANLAASVAVIDTNYLPWRAHLTHGVLGVWRGRKSQWLITLHYREKDNAGPIRWHAIPYEDAEAKLEQFCAELKKFGQRCDALQRQHEESKA